MGTLASTMGTANGDWPACSGAVLIFPKWNGHLGNLGLVGQPLVNMKECLWVLWSNKMFMFLRL